MNPKELAELEALLAAPERVEIHGSDRKWRAHLLGTLMAAAALSFGNAQAGPESAGLPVAAAAAGSETAFEASVAAAMRRAGAQQIATATRSTKVSAFPFAYSATLSGPELGRQVERFVSRSPGLLPPVNGGTDRTGAYIATIAPQIATPHAWAYASKSPDRTGCVILVSDHDVPEFRSLMKTAGIDAETAAAYVLAHEAAHCAQYSEGIAALRDVALTGKVRPERVQSNLLDVRFERLLMVRAPSEKLMEMSVERKRSSERYADGFSVLSMLARGALTMKQLEGIASWRAETISKDGHGTSEFLLHLRDAVVADPKVLATMRSPAEPGFDAQAVAAFLKPQWKAFEMRELEAEVWQLDQKSRQAPDRSSKVEPMTTFAQRFTDQERTALELMLQAPEAVEMHGTDLAWQEALSQVTSPVQPKPSLKDALMAGSVHPADSPRGG
ncbi:hypothetical protein LJR290_008000 [Variovorax sp. LjRoot290]|uniref:hypothetical protein n=1 Tax=Variovorax sp. LjRoot290 TaxID=3342316 RepID=UPI003ED161EA